MDTDTPEHGFFTLDTYRPAAVSSKPRHRAITDEECDSVFRWRAEGVTRVEIARRLHIPAGSLFDITREARGRGHLAHPRLIHLPRQQGQNGGRPWGTVAEAAERDPTPAEIRLACEAFQGKWTHAEHYARLHGHAPDTYRPTLGMAAQRKVHVP